MNRFFFALLLALSFSLNAQIEGPRPKWVEPSQRLAPRESLKSGGVQALLYDHQVNFKAQHSYYAYSYLLESSDAVANYSNIQVNYDPGYQQLIFHRIAIIREGKEIDMLARHQASVMHYESNRNRLIYDSTMTMVYHLEDVREGDILEYEFSRIGQHPAFPNHYYTSEYLQNYRPMAKINFRVLVPNDMRVQVHYKAGAEPPSMGTYPGYKVYQWQKEYVEEAEFEEGEPESYDPRPSVSLSNYSSWRKLAQEANELYSFRDADLIEVKQQAMRLSLMKESVEEKLSALVRFVQDEVRYLGFEAGVHAFEPHDPQQVLRQRFGDCKDKSILLVEMIRSIGLEAYPIWVNTYRGGRLDPNEVSPFVFNHCVTMTFLDGDTIYIDPTWSEQGGSIRDLNFPSYKQAMVVGPKTRGLIKLKEQLRGSIEVYDKFGIPQASNQPAAFDVKTVYNGYEADNLRSYFESNSLSSITDDYLSYYKSYFPYIRSRRNLEIDDDREANRIEVKEYYLLDSLWEDYQSSQQSVTVYMPNLITLFNIPDNGNRSAPYQLTYPKQIDYKTEILLPEDWPLEEEQFNLERLEYSYNYKVEAHNANSKILILQNYQTLKSEITATDYNRLVDDHDNFLVNANGYSITRLSDKASLNFTDEASTTEWLSYLLRFITLIASVFLLMKLHNWYDPVPAGGYKKQLLKPLGGWLILPLLGLILAPFLRVYNEYTTYDEETFLRLSQMMFGDASLFNPTFIALIAFEIIINTATTVFIVYLLVQFIRQRSSVPRLLIIFYAFNILWQSLDAIFVYSLGYGFDSGAEIFRSIVAAAIWIPYFLFSTRVKETFTVMQNPPKPISVPVESEDSPTAIQDA